MDPTHILLARVATMRDKFIASYSEVVLATKNGNSLATNKALVTDMATQRVDMAIALFYKQLETLLKMVCWCFKPFTQ